MNTDVIIASLGVAALIWVGLGFIGFGMAYAFLQRHYPNEQQRFIWWQFINLLPSVLWGPYNILHVYLRLQERGGWDYRNSRPLYGYKFLPRHDHR